MGGNGNKESEDEKGEQDKGLSICFQNVAGLNKKYKELKRYFEKFDILGLTETWIDKEEWQTLEKHFRRNLIGHIYQQ